MNHCCMMTDSYFDVSHSTLRCTCSKSPFKVKKRKEKQPVKWIPHKNIPGVVSLTAVPLLCFQAWDPAESPGECTSSPTAPSASPWAGRAPGAGGGDPGLRRWGARRPRRLLQRSDKATRTSTNTNTHFPKPSLPLSTSVALSSTMASLSCCDRCSSRATSRLFGCCQKNERQCFRVSCCGSGCQRLCCLPRGLFSLCGSVSMIHPFCQQCGQMSLNICMEICAATSYMFFVSFFYCQSLFSAVLVPIIIIAFRCSDCSDILFLCIFFNLRLQTSLWSLFCDQHAATVMFVFVLVTSLWREQRIFWCTVQANTSGIR